ncbi:MAG: hypothetical protein ACLUD0_14425 [Eubacterium ramulus]
MRYLVVRRAVLMDVMGLRSTEIDGLYDGESNTVKAVVGDVAYKCEHLCQLVEC